MPEVQDRIEKLGNSILSDARRKAEEIIIKAQQQADKLTEQAREQYRRSEESKIALDRQKTHTLYAKEISKSDFAAHKSVLAHRCELVDGLFENIRTKLEEFAKSSDYKDYMIALAKKANDEQAFAKDCIINVSRNDKQLANDIAEKYGIGISVDRNIELGGLSVYYPSDNIYIDYTLDLALEQKRKAFVASHSELSL